MVRTAVQKIADVLIFLCGFLIFCDILLLPLTPALAYFRFQNPASMRFDHLLAVFAYDFDDGVGNLLEIILKESWKSPETAVLAIMEATRPSVTALALPRSTTAPATWKILRAVSATARGTSAASFKPFCMASFLAAFSSSVFFGIPRAFIYAVKDSVSFWMESISSFLRAAPSAVTA